MTIRNYDNKNIQDFIKSISYIAIFAYRLFKA